MCRALFVLLLLPALCGAHPAVETLLGAPLPPAQEEAAVRELIAADLPPGALEPLLARGQHRATAISAAKVIRARLRAGDLDLAPLAYRAFLDSKHHLLPHDPDVFERLLLGLQEAGPEVLTRLPGAESGEVVDAAWRTLHQDLLSPLGPDIDWQQPDLTLEARAWTEALLQQPQPLVRLQTDSGDAAFRLFERLQADQVAALIRSSGGRQLDLAVEAWSLRFRAWPNPNEALRDRGLTGRLLDPPPPAPTWAAHLRPRGPDPDLSGVTDQRLATPPGPTSALWLLALVPILWVGALRRFPERRAGLFRLGAVIFGVSLLGLAEGVLTLAGVEPLLTARPQIYSYRGTEAALNEGGFRPVGPDHVYLDSGDARQQVFSTAPTVPRVFVFGESSAHGSNHLAEEAFAARLASSLGVEVINAGIGGAISDEIVPVATQALEFSPDVFVLYFGYNDLSRLPAMVELRAFSPAILQVRELLDRSRVVRLLADVVPAEWLQIPPADVLTDEAGDGMSVEQVRRVQGLARNHAARNLGRILHEAEAAGVRCVVAVQALNAAACSPTGGHPADPRACVAEDLRGIALDAAAGTDAIVVDVPAALEQHAGGPAADDYFWDSIHPSRLGHAVLAKALEPAVSEALGR